MKPSATDVRTRVVQAYAHHAGAMRQLAPTFRVRVSCVRRLIQPSRETGRVAPTSHGGGSPATVDARGRALVQARVPAAPAATRRERCQRCEGRSPPSSSMAPLSRVLAALQVPRQKNVSCHGTSARRGAAAAGRLPGGEARVCAAAAGLCRRIRPPSSPDQGAWPCPSGAACHRCQARTTGAPGHEGRGVGLGRSGGGHEGGRRRGRSRRFGLCAGGAGASTAARAGGGAR